MSNIPSQKPGSGDSQIGQDSDRCIEPSAAPHCRDHAGRDTNNTAEQKGEDTYVKGHGQAVQQAVLIPFPNRRSTFQSRLSTPRLIQSKYCAGMDLSSPYCCLRAFICSRRDCFQLSLGDIEHKRVTGQETHGPEHKYGYHHQDNYALYQSPDDIRCHPNLLLPSSLLIRPAWFTFHRGLYLLIQASSGVHCWNQNSDTLTSRTSEVFAEIQTHRDKSGESLPVRPLCFSSSPGTMAALFLGIKLP